MEKRYQVFISSTYADLHEERQEVMQALLELDCIPAGMELFPAANEDQWTLIKKVIDDCDYYIVIVAGRYGSIGPCAISYTEMEYRYALEIGKPVIGFIHKNPGELPSNRCEDSIEGKEKLILFKQLVQKKMCKFWNSPAELGSQVSRSLINLIKIYPGVGWVRGNLILDQSSVEEILQLRNEIDKLQSELDGIRTKAPDGTEQLSSGDDTYSIHFTFGASDGYVYNSEISISWNEIFGVVSPLMIDEASDLRFRNAINALIYNNALHILKAKKKFKALELDEFMVNSDNFQTIKIQLRALGLITKSQKVRSVKDAKTYWTLTPYGDTVMTRIRAIKKE